MYIYVYIYTCVYICIIVHTATWIYTERKPSSNKEIPRSPPLTNSLEFLRLCAGFLMCVYSGMIYMSTRIYTI